jgi:hypothetical protein
MTAAVEETGWLHTFDFTLDDGGFYAPTSLGYPVGTYEHGVGWKTTYNVYYYFDYRAIQILREFPEALRLTKITAEFTFSLGTFNFTGDYTFYFYFPLFEAGGTWYNTVLDPSIPASPQVWTGDKVTDNLYISIEPSATVGSLRVDPGGEAILTSVTIEGIGINPFLQHECCVCAGNYAGIDCDET